LAEVDLAAQGECECPESGQATPQEAASADMLAETETDQAAGGNQDMSAINLIDNERNMHMVPAPVQPTCCNN